MNSISQRFVHWTSIVGLLAATITEANHAPPHTHEPAVEFADLVPPVINATGISPTALK
jgi:hypothetical protein